MKINIILVEDIVNQCWECQFSSCDLDWCSAVERELENDGRDRPDWCPLVAGKIIPTIRKGYLLIKESEE